MEESLDEFMQDKSQPEKIVWINIFSDLCNEQISPEDVIDAVENFSFPDDSEVKA